MPRESGRNSQLIRWLKEHYCQECPVYKHIEDIANHKDWYSELISNWLECPCFMRPCEVHNREIENPENVES